MDKIYKRINWENKPSKNTAVNEENLNRMDYAVDAVDTRVCELAGYEERAAKSALAAKSSETNAAVSEGRAKTSETNAKTSETNAGVSAASAGENALLSKSYAAGGTNIRTDESTDNAKYYKEQAQMAQSSSLVSAANAASSAEKASASEKNAKVSENNVKTSETHTRTSEINAQSSAAKASAWSDTALVSADKSESYAVGGTGTRAGEDTDNAKYYKEQTERIAEGLKGSLIPMGTILFAALPDTSTAGYMFNISEEFTTTSRFKEGAGNIIPAGTNVYYTADGFWDCMAGTPVTGIKGDAESSYRRGNVNLTKEHIGLGKVPNVTTNDQIPTFTQAATRSNLVSGGKLSVMFGNIAKWLADLKSGAFSTVVNNDTTTTEGCVADARIVRTHGIEIDNLSSALATHKSSADHDGRYYTKWESNNSNQNLLNQINSKYETFINRLTPTAGLAANTGAAGGYAYCDKYDRLVVTRICLRVVNKTGVFTNYNLANLPYTAADLGIGTVVSQNNGMNFPVSVSKNSNVLVLENKAVTPTSDDWLWGNIIYISK